jgi:hypothetical protein
MDPEQIGSLARIAGLIAAAWLLIALLLAGLWVIGHYLIRMLNRQLDE